MAHDTMSRRSSASEKKKVDEGLTPPEYAVVDEYAPDLVGYKPEIQVADLKEADAGTVAQVLDTERLDVTPNEYDRVLRKIDWYLMPFMIVPYLLCFVDKSTINYAHLFNFQKDLHFDQAQYSWLGSIFYLAYVAAQPVHSVLFQKVPLGRYLGVNVFLWGITLTLHAACFNYAGMVVCRVALGLFESSITPGFIHITGRFYSGQEINTRTAIWFSCNGWAQVLGGLIGFGMLRQSHSAIPLWRECFLILGLITVAFGVATLLLFPSEPSKLMILTERERLIAVERVRANETGGVSHKWEWYQLREALIDPRVWTLFFCIVSMDVSNGALTNFSTMVISTLGFDQQKTSLLGLASGGSEILACLLVIIGSRYVKPSIMGSFCLVVSIAGAGVMASNTSNVAKAAMYCACMNWFAPASMVLYASLARSFSGETKRVVATAIFSIGYAVGNIIGAQIYPAKDAPEYVPAKITMLTLLTVSLVAYMAFFLTHIYLNRTRDNEFGSNPEHNAVEDLSNQTDWEKKRFFRYPL